MTSFLVLLIPIVLYFAHRIITATSKSETVERSRSVSGPVRLRNGLHAFRPVARPVTENKPGKVTVINPPESKRSESRYPRRKAS